MVSAEFTLFESVINAISSFSVKVSALAGFLFGNYVSWCCRVFDVSLDWPLAPSLFLDGGLYFFTFSFSTF